VGAGAAPAMNPGPMWFFAHVRAAVQDRIGPTRSAGAGAAQQPCRALRIAVLAHEILDWCVSASDPPGRRSLQSGAAPFERNRSPRRTVWSVWNRGKRSGRWVDNPASRTRPHRSLPESKQNLPNFSDRVIHSRSFPSPPGTALSWQPGCWRFSGCASPPPEGGAPGGGVHASRGLGASATTSTRSSTLERSRRCSWRPRPQAGLSALLVLVRVIRFQQGQFAAGCSIKAQVAADVASFDR